MCVEKTRRGGVIVKPQMVYTLSKDMVYTFCVDNCLTKKDHKSEHSEGDPISLVVSVL